MYINGNIVTYFDSFGVEHIPEEIKRFNRNKNIMTNIFRIHASESIKCVYFYVGFIDFMFNSKNLKDFANLFSLHNFKKNDKLNSSRLFFEIKYKHDCSTCV